MTRALVVDDRADNVYLLRVLLEAQGYIVDGASDGIAALSLARVTPPDLIVSDLLMPVLDGYALLRHWRADDRLKSIPFVVYIATYTAPQDRELAFALGADDFIIKPAEPEELLASILAVMERRSRGEVRRATTSAADETALLRQYNEVLINKLEQKLLQVERTNRELQNEIDERKRLQAQADEASRLLRAVMDSTTDAVFVKDRKGRYLIYNAAATRFAGKSATEVLGRDDLEVFGTDLARTVMANDRVVMDSNEVHTVEELVPLGGVERLFLTTKAPYRDSFGNVIGMVGIAHDITERKHLEEQLRQSQKMEAIGRLAGGIAHDFNNLLTIIASYSEILLAQDDTSVTVSEAARAIAAAGQRASTLTKQLLGFSRQVMLQPQVLDLNAVVADTGEMLRRLIGADVEFITVREPSLSPVKVDRTQLDQVLMNLAVNARDAMPEGGQLTIQAANVRIGEAQRDFKFECAPGNYAMLAISDTGRGMTPDVLAHIFRAVLHDETRRQGYGTRLGGRVRHRATERRLHPSG